MLRLLSMMAVLSLSAAAIAQTAPPAAQQVQLLAPQLVAFSGSSANFESLVNGLTQGTAVTLTTPGADGLQIVTFIPGTTLSAADAARSLEAARQSLISRGIASPTAQQLASALMGGTLLTPAGSTPVTGVVSGNTGTTAIQVRNELATANLAAGNLQALRAGLAQGTPVTLSGASGPVSFVAPGGALTPFAINQALQLASVLLAQQGILDPTPEQLRVALLGGNLGTGAASVPVQGVLQGQVRNTSDNPLSGTSNGPIPGTTSVSPILGTSNSRTIGILTTSPGSASAAAPAAGPAPAPGAFRR
jgi:hypothetical protein